MKRRPNIKENKNSEKNQQNEDKNVRRDLKQPEKLCCYQNRTQMTVFSVLFVISFCVLLTAINIYELRRIESSRQIIIREITQPTVAVAANITEERRPTYWLYSTSLSPMKHVLLVLERLGYRQGTNDSDWDLLWSFDYPFTNLYSQLSNLKEHQKVNHIPGCGLVTSKVDLATTASNWIPLAFRLPEHKDQLLQYATNNPQKLFVQKDNTHRNIRIQNVKTLDFNNSNTFVQEFMDRPFLVDGYKFDLGIYTIITSIDPLRIYIYSGDVLFRYCLEKYYPFDPENVDKYVVGTKYRPTWDVPALEKWFNDLGFSMKDSFDAYVRSTGRDPRKIWMQAEEAIREIYLKKSEHMKTLIKNKYNNKLGNFFELVRCDFVVDEELKVHLMEINMSPNLISHSYPKNRHTYEQILFNMFGLIGIGTTLRKPSLVPRTREEEDMQVSIKNIAVFPNKCASKLCENSCAADECELCLPCMSISQKKTLFTAYKEYVNRGDCTRIFPPMSIKEEDIQSTLLALSPENRFLYKWFLGKCMLDKSWCN